MFSRISLISLISLLHIGSTILTPCMAQTLPNQDSPFGIYSPYGEFLIDRGTYATIEDISAYLQDIGVAWVQELPFARYSDIPQGMHIYSRVGREGGMQPSRIWDTTYRAQYQTALRQSARNNKDRVKYWEVDTEPDGVGGWKSDPKGYVELLKITRAVFQEECSECKLIFGGLSGGTSVLNTQSNAFLEKALAAGAPGYFDVLEFKWHHMAAKDYRLIKNKFDGLGSTLSRYGVDIHTIPVFVEGAQYDGDPNQPVPRSSLPIQTEKEQAWGLLKMYVYGLSIGIDKVFWNLLFERSDYEPGHTVPFAQNPFNHYGLIHNPTNADSLSGKKLSYYTYKKMVEVLEGSDWKNIATVQEQDGIYIYKFTKQGKPIWVAWNDSSVTRTIIISGISSNRVKTTEAVPKHESGKDVIDYAKAFQTDTLVVTNSAVALTLGQRPVFIEPSTITKVEEEDENVPQEFVLYQNYPNPFNPSTTIRFFLPQRTYVTLKVFDVLGKEVVTLVDDYKQPGIYNSQFSIRNLPASRQGFQLPSGVYFYQLSAGGKSITRKLILIR